MANSPDYLNLVSNFKKMPTSEITSFYSKEKNFGINYENLIGNAIDKYGMTPDEAHAVYGYTTKLFYRDLNRTLEAGGSPEANALSNLINSGLSKLPDSGMIQFRGLRVNNPSDITRFEGDFSLGNTVTTKSYWSTAPNETDAYLGDRNMVLNTNAGTAPNVSDLSFGVNFHSLIGKPVYSSEAIIPPGVKFNVVDIDANGRYILEQQ